MIELISKLACRHYFILEEAGKTKKRSKGSKKNNFGNVTLYD